MLGVMLVFAIRCLQNLRCQFLLPKVACDTEASMNLSLMCFSANANLESSETSLENNASNAFSLNFSAILCKSQFGIKPVN